MSVADATRQRRRLIGPDFLALRVKGTKPLPRVQPRLMCAPTEEMVAHVPDVMVTSELKPGS